MSIIFLIEINKVNHFMPFFNDNAAYTTNKFFYYNDTLCIETFVWFLKNKIYNDGGCKA